MSPPLTRTRYEIEGGSRAEKRARGYNPRAAGPSIARRSFAAAGCQPKKSEYQELR